jgi:hypothetical protein
MAPVIFDALRLAERGCTVRELAMHVMVDHAMDADNCKLLGEVTERVSGLLRHYRKRGIVRSCRLPWAPASLLLLVALRIPKSRKRCITTESTKCLTVVSGLPAPRLRIHRTEHL